MDGLQAKFTADQLKKISEVLEIPGVETLNQLGDHWWPNRGIGPMPPTDPVLYRLYEASSAPRRSPCSVLRVLV
jgi:cyanate lyase